MLLEEVSTSFDHFLHESPIWNMTRPNRLEGPKLEHGAIGKDDSGSAYRYNDSSPNLLHHGNRKELYWHQSGSTTLFIWLWLMFCVFCVRTMHMHADWVQCITHVTSTSGWITEYIYRIPCQRIVEGVFFQNRSSFGSHITPPLCVLRRWEISHRRRTQSGGVMKADPRGRPCLRGGSHSSQGSSQNYTMLSSGGTPQTLSAWTILTAKE